MGTNKNTADYKLVFDQAIKILYLGVDNVKSNKPAHISQGRWDGMVKRILQDMKSELNARQGN